MQVIAGVLGRAGEAGQKQRLAAAARGSITYRPAKGLVMPGTEDEDGTPITEDTKKNNASTQKPGRGVADLPSTKDIMDTDELEGKLDEVTNQEDHRLKGGRNLKRSA
jgi:small subunit ribosomal protein S2